MLLKIGLVAIVLAFGSVAPSGVAYKAGACITMQIVMQNVCARPGLNNCSRSWMSRVGTQAQFTAPLKQKNLVTGAPLRHKNLVTGASKCFPSTGKHWASVCQALGKP